MFFSFKLRTISSQKFKLYRSVIREKHKKSRIFSGIQPTGVPHLGNYFGAIRSWIKLQNEGNKCVFSIVDLHSITVPQSPDTLRYNIHLMAACLLACGIEPSLSVFFLQSQVPQHAELAKVLGCLTTMARLTHLPQYKEKSSTLKDIPLGLFLYPLLQSADILLYKATHVPVGEDQLQHIQLSQHLVKVFNNKYGKIFPTPQALIDNQCARIKSLSQPDKKMSKSDSDINSRINLTDDPDTVVHKINQSTYDKTNQASVDNLNLIYSLCTETSNDLENNSLDMKKFKINVAEAVIEHLYPIRTKITEFMSEPLYINDALKAGCEKAFEMASKTMLEVKIAVGLPMKVD